MDKEYASYTTVDQKWVAQIPSHWEMKRLKGVFAMRKERNNPIQTDFILSLTAKQGVVPYAEKEGTGGNKPKDDLTQYNICRENDLLVNCMNVVSGAAGVSKYYGAISPVYYAFYPREEQDQIVKYLDWKVSEVNRLIAVKKKQVSAYKELRKAVIDQGILHGFRESEKKDSGVYWLGEIPDSWEVLPLKRICRANASIADIVKTKDDSELVTFLPMENVTETGEIDCSIKKKIAEVRTGFSSFAKGDVVVAKITPCFENGKGACLDDLDSDIGFGTTEFINLRPSDKVISEYLYMITMTRPFRKLGEEVMTGSAGQKRVSVQIGDYVVFPSKTDRMINIGIVESDYFFEDNDGEYVQRRKVKWLKHMPRLSFSQGALYEVGSAMSFFSVKNYADEFLSALDRDFKKLIASDDSEDESIGATAEDIVESTKDFILKELSRQLKGYELEAFVADLLRAMGYRTTVSPQGGDSGIDITAYKDELPPRILVQVKSQDSDIKETTIQSLKGAMREGDYGLFVTLSNYTKNAQKYLDSTPIIRGINGTELVDLILKYYEELSEKYRKMIPLKMVYIPVPKTTE